MPNEFLFWLAGWQQQKTGISIMLISTQLGNGLHGLLALFRRWHNVHHEAEFVVGTHVVDEAAHPEPHEILDETAHPAGGVEHSLDSSHLERVFVPEPGISKSKFYF